MGSLRTRGRGGLTQHGHIAAAKGAGKTGAGDWVEPVEQVAQVLGRHAVQGAGAVFVTVVVCHRVQVVDLPDGLFRTVVQTLQEHGFLPALQAIIYRLLLGRGQGEIVSEPGQGL